MAEIEWETIMSKGTKYALPDGGEVEITDPEFVKLGDGFTHRVLTYQRGGCEIVFEVRDGVPGCTSINLSTDGGFVRQKYLAALRLDDIRERVYTVVGIGMTTDEEDGYGNNERSLSEAEMRKEITRASTRRKITPEFLRRVAEIHQSASEGGRLSAVIGAFGVSERQALRYIGQAKREGFIQ